MILFTKWLTHVSTLTKGGYHKCGDLGNKPQFKQPIERIMAEMRVDGKDGIVPDGRRLSDLIDENKAVRGKSL